MIALSKYHQALRLLSEGQLSQRKIAAAVGISRATVSAIAQGKYRDREARQRERARADQFEPTGPLVRCPTCGGRVQMPCLLCRVRELKDRERQILRARRRQARRQKLARLLNAVREASRRRDASESVRQPGGYSPPAPEFGPSDSR